LPGASTASKADDYEKAARSIAEIPIKARKLRAKANEIYGYIPLVGGDASDMAKVHKLDSDPGGSTFVEGGMRRSTRIKLSVD
jgi:hypothetical protein